MPESDKLTLEISRHLEIDWQDIEHVEAWNTERIAAIRSAGREAGRLLGWKMVTFQSDPAQRDDGRVVVAKGSVVRSRRSSSVAGMSRRRGNPGCTSTSTPPTAIRTPSSNGF